MKDYPQPHDIPMDAIVTESGVARFRNRDDPAKAEIKRSD